MRPTAMRPAPQPAWRLLAPVLVVALLAVGCSAEPDPPSTTASPGGARSSDATSGPRPDGGPGPVGRWRTEVWRDVQLRVPSAWYVGFSPMRRGTSVLSCGVGPSSLVDGARPPYVGRPGFGSDMCVRQDAGQVRPRGTSVWFDSPLEAGTFVTRSGLRSTTVEVGNTRVTVSGRDRETSDRILGSVRRVGPDANGCEARPGRLRSFPAGDHDDPLSLSVCLYRRDAVGASWQREWSTRLAAGRAVRLLAAWDDAVPARPCGRSAPQLILLRVRAESPTGGEPVLRDFAVRPQGCSAVESAAAGARSTWVRLSPPLVRPWALAGVRTYAVAFGLPPSLGRFFRPVLA